MEKLIKFATKTNIMSSNTLLRKAPFKEKIPRRIFIETFLRKYRKGGSGIKYEYNKGIIEKTEAMNFASSN